MLHILRRRRDIKELLKVRRYFSVIMRVLKEYMGLKGYGLGIISLGWRVFKISYIKIRGGFRGIGNVVIVIGVRFISIRNSRKLKVVIAKAKTKFNLSLS